MDLTQLKISLRALEGSHGHDRVSLGHADADQALGGGLLSGALHEVFAEKGHGIAASGFSVALASRVSGRKPLLFIRQDFTSLEHGELAGSGVAELGRHAREVLLLRVADARDGLKAMADALSCASLGAVIFELSGNHKILDLTASRKLVLAAAQTGVTAFLTRLDAVSEASAAETRWRVRASPSVSEDWGSPRFGVELSRNRHGPLGRWTLEWDGNHGRFGAAPYSGTLAETTCNRQDRTETQSFRRTG